MQEEMQTQQIQQNTPAPYAAGTGSVPVETGRENLRQMSYRERLALKRENPEAYRAMRGE